MSSKLDKSAIVAGAGLVASIFTTLVKKVHERGGVDEDIHYLATSDGEKILDKFAEIIVGTKRQTFEILVDYAKSLKDMIKAGNYDWANNDITQDHFPVVGSGKEKKTLILFHFDRNISSDDAIAEMAKAGCEPEDIAALLALGENQPELQRQFPIIALKSVWRAPVGARRVPFLYGGAGARRLRLSFFDGGWAGGFRFLARRK